MKGFGVLSLVVLSLAGCSDIDLGMSLHGIHVGGQGPSLVGNGVKKEESRKVAAFDRIAVCSALQVKVTEGKAEPVRITADSNLLGNIKTEVKKGTLYVSVTGSVSTKSPLSIVVSTPSLRGMDASGATKVDATLKQRHDLDLVDSGASSVMVTGPVANLWCQLSGASKAHFSSSKMDKVKVSLTGASILTATSEVDSLNAELSGASSMTGGFFGNTAALTLSGASDVSIGKFRSLIKRSSGASNIRMP